jgi:hypothetical protein
VQNAPRTGYRKPEQSDGPLGGVQIGNLASDVEPDTAPYFATTAARDAAHADFVTAGGVMRDGLLARVNGIGLMQYVGGSWYTVATTADIAALAFPGPLKETHGTGQYDHTGTTEVQVGGGTNEIGTITGLALKSNRCYRAVFRGRAWAGVAGVTMSLRIRVGASLSTSSSAVASRQIVQPNVGPGGVNDTPVEGEFAVQTTGTYSCGLYGVVASGSFAVGPDARGRYELIVFDVGPSISGLATVTA